jgi:small GTP-binding protein
MSQNYKVCVVGARKTGKTSLVVSYKTGKMPKKAEESRSATDHRFAVELQQYGEKVGLEVWDIPGDEQTMALHRMNVRDTHAVIFVYDICNKDSLTNLEKWINEVKEAGPN